MKSTDTIAAVTGIGIAILAGVFAFTYGLGTFEKPGPGLLPLLICIFLVVCNLILILKDRPNSLSVRKITFGSRWYNVIYVMIASFAYTVLWEIGGFLLNTFLLVGYFIFAIGKESAIKSILWAIFITLASYYLFKKVMGVELPDGLLNLRF